MTTKYQIFISSTYEDLKEERVQVIEAVLKLGHIPVGMEMFNAGNKTQWELIKKRIEDCDYYVVIVAHRYGSEKSGKSYTEKEFDYAKKLRKPILGFVIDKNAGWDIKKSDSENIDLKIKKLDKFKSKIKDGRIINFWMDKGDLSGKVNSLLTDAINESPQTGWVRADFLNKKTKSSNEIIGKNDMFFATIVKHNDPKRESFFAELYKNLEKDDLIRIMGTGATKFLENETFVEDILDGGYNIEILLINNEIVKKDWNCTSDDFLLEIESKSKINSSNKLTEELKVCCPLANLNFLIDTNHFNNYHYRKEYNKKIEKSVTKVREFQNYKSNAVKPGKLTSKHFKSFVPLSITAIFNDKTNKNNLVAEFIVPFSDNRIIFHSMNNENSSAYKLFMDFFTSTWLKSTYI